MYFEQTRGLGAAAAWQYEYSLTGASRMIKRTPKKRNALTAEQLNAQNAFMAKIAAQKPKRLVMPPMAVRFR